MENVVWIFDLLLLIRLVQSKQSIDLHSQTFELRLKHKAKTLGG